MFCFAQSGSNPNNSTMFKKKDKKDKKDTLRGKEAKEEGTEAISAVYPSPTDDEDKVNQQQLNLFNSLFHRKRWKVC